MVTLLRLLHVLEAASHRQNARAAGEIRSDMLGLQTRFAGGTGEDCRIGNAGDAPRFLSDLPRLLRVAAMATPCRRP
jgi:hypothetical protein